MQSIGPNFRWITGALALGLAVSVGCGGDDADDGASTDGSGDDSGSSGPSSATMPTSMSMTDPADDDADGDAPGSSDSADSSSGAADTSDGGSSGAGSSGDTGLTGCAALDQAACMVDAACMPISGSPIVVRGDVVCQGQREFIECQDSQACAEIVTTACEDGATMPYSFGNACIPTGWASCDAPDGGPFPPC